MRRQAAVAAVILAGSWIAWSEAPAQADDPTCYSVPALPETCLTLEARDYIVSVETQRDKALDDYADQRQLNGNLSAQNGQLRSQLWELAGDVQKARQLQSIAESDLVIAYDQLDRYQLRIVALRAKLKTLRGILEDVR